MKILRHEDFGLYGICYHVCTYVCTYVYHTCYVFKSMTSCRCVTVTASKLPNGMYRISGTFDGDFNLADLS